MRSQLIADSGATKCEWRYVNDECEKQFITPGISPYFTTVEDITKIIDSEVLRDVNGPISEVYFYGTGLGNPANVTLMQEILERLLPDSTISCGTDMLAAARALAKNERGVISILGTGSNACYYNGATITKNRPALGYVLGDEGSGAYLGKKVVQHYLYGIFENDLCAAFEHKFKTGKDEILNHVYKQPQASRYLAGFTYFLAEHRGHYMIENILQDGLGEFFSIHLEQLEESKSNPIHFIGSVAEGFKDVIEELCIQFGFKIGTVLKQPMDELVRYHLLNSSR